MVRSRPRRPISALWGAFRAIETPMMWFVLVNVLDFVVTWRLIAVHSNSSFVERNPVARYFLYSWGPFRGLLAFKLVIVAVVCTIALVVALRRTSTAVRLLQFGVIVVGGVVAYSVALFFRHQ